MRVHTHGGLLVGVNLVCVFTIVDAGVWVCVCVYDWDWAVSVSVCECVYRWVRGTVYGSITLMSMNTYMCDYVCMFILSCIRLRSRMHL